MDFGHTKFYYPMPDYKLPNVIFSDEYKPTKETMQNYTPYLSGEAMSVEYNEKIAYADIIKNDMFDFFANSFFIEARTEKIDTKVDLAKQDLIKIDESMKAFYDTHYKIGKLQENRNLEKQLLEENQKLKEELNQMANSKSWKITKPFRELRKKQ